MDQTLVMLTTQDHDIGLWPIDTAVERAQELAAELQQPVSVRDAITDEIIEVVRLRLTVKLAAE